MRRNYCSHCGSKLISGGLYSIEKYFDNFYKTLRRFPFKENEALNLYNFLINNKGTVGDFAIYLSDKYNDDDSLEKAVKSSIYGSSLTVVILTIIYKTLLDNLGDMNLDDNSRKYFSLAIEEIQQNKDRISLEAIEEIVEKYINNSVITI